MIVWPNPNTAFLDWADSLRLLRPDIEIQPRVTDENDWQNYANQVIQSEICQTNSSPRPEGFSDWRQWAVGLIKSFGQNT